MVDSTLVKGKARVNSIFIKVGFRWGQGEVLLWIKIDVGAEMLHIGDLY